GRGVAEADRDAGGEPGGVAANRLSTARFQGRNRGVTMQTIRVLEKTGKDGTLLLRIPLGKPETEFEVIVVAQPKPTAMPPGPEELGWPPGYFENTYGSITDDTFGRSPEGK